MTNRITTAFSSNMPYLIERLENSPVWVLKNRNYDQIGEPFIFRAGFTDRMRKKLSNENPTVEEGRVWLYYAEAHPQTDPVIMAMYMARLTILMSMTETENHQCFNLSTGSAT